MYMPVLLKWLVRLRSLLIPNPSVVPAAACGQVFMNLCHDMKHVGDTTQNLEHGSLGCRNWAGEFGLEKLGGYVLTGRVAGAVRREQLGGRATTARWAARWRGDQQPPQASRCAGRGSGTLLGQGGAGKGI